MSQSVARPYAVVLDVVTYALGGAAQRAAFLLLVPVLGWLLSAADYGRWMVFIALLPMLTAILDFGFSKAVGRYYFDNDESSGSLAAFLTRAICLRLVMFAVLVPIVLLGLWLSWSLLTGNSLPLSGFLALMLTACTFEAVILGVTAFSRARQIAWVFGVVRVGQGALTIALCFLLARTNGLVGAAVGLTLANLVSASVAFAWAVAWIRRQPRLDVAPGLFSDAGVMTRYGAPVVVHDLSWWIRNSSTLVILTHFVSSAVVGAYAIGFAALSLVAMLSWSLDFATAPSYYRWRKREVDWQKNTRNMLTVMNGLIFMVVCVGILFFSDIRGAFFGSKFAEADSVAPLLLVAGMLQPLYFVAVKPYFYLKRTALLSSITFTTSAVVVAGTVLAVYKFGYAAAAAMTVVSFGFIAVAAYLLSRRLEPPPFKLSRGLFPAVASGALAALVYFISTPLFVRILIALALISVAGWVMVKVFRAMNSRHAFQS